MDNLQAINEFFKLNMAIKNLLVKLSPTFTDGYDLESTMNYEKKLEDGMDYMKDYLKKMATILGRPNWSEHIDEIFRAALNKIIACNYNFNTLVIIYNEFFQSMNPEIIKNLNEQVVGYLMMSNPGKVFSSCQSVNEMLHVLHHSMINNEYIYQSMPVVAKYQAENKERILYGQASSQALAIYSDLDEKIESSIIEILSINENKIIIMARDLGHALTLELEFNETEVLIRYFIPKICNYIMVNNLPGVRPVTRKSKSTTGEFLCKKEELVTKLNQFMLSVPTDDHMFIKGGLCEEVEEKTTQQLK